MNLSIRFDEIGKTDGIAGAGAGTWFIDFTDDGLGPGGGGRRAALRRVRAG